MVRRALVLSGGGARGSFEVGVIEELILKRGLDFQIFCGISAGALNASVLAQAKADPDPAASLRNLQDTFRELRKIWLERITGTGSILRQRLLGLVGIAVGADSVFDVDALERLLNESVSPQRIMDSQRLLRVQYAELETGNLVTVTDRGRDLIKGILASATVPVFFPPVKLDGKHLVDGGVRDGTPIGTAFEAEPPPEVIYVVYAQPAKLDPVSYQDSVLGFRVGARDFLMRALEIIFNELDLDDVEGAIRFNMLKLHWERLKPLLPQNADVQAIDSVLGPIKYAKIIEIRPQRLITKDALQFLPAEIRANYDHGKEIGAGVPPEERVTLAHRASA